MRVKSYLATVILVCLAGGYLIELVLTDQFGRANRAVQLYNESVLWQKDFDRVVDDISQFLLTVDLVLGSDTTYLIYGAVDKSEYIVNNINLLLEQRLPASLDDDLSLATKDIFSIQEYVIRAGSDSESNRGDFLNLLLDESDKAATSLIERIYRIRGVISDVRQQREIVVGLENTNAKRVKYTSRAVFSIVVLVLWIWANRQISRPLRHLTLMAKAAETGDEFVGVTSGPLEVMELSENTKRLTNSLSYEAAHDTLTDLYNRREFERLLNKHFSSQLNPNDSLNYVLAYLDLDHFKIVNDTCGHGAGDELLAKVAILLQEGVRSSDFVARLGGDEFAILLIGCDLPTGLEICNKLRQSIVDLEYHYGSEIYRISASIGITDFLLNDEKLTLDDVVNTADTACKVAKDSGRDRVHVFNVGDETLAKKRHEMLVVNQINSALENDRFVLHRQYIVPLQYQSKPNSHYEILLRMQSSDGKLIFPNDFLPVAEQYYLGARLDRWVFNALIEWLIATPSEMEQLETCAINLSGQSIGSKDFLDFVVAKLNETNFPSAKLCFEITETAAITDLDKAYEFISRLKAEGCRFALDDFGSGLSSFAYLKTLDVDTIKIDGVFVKNMLEDTVNYATVKSICELAKAVNMDTIAEFVENEEISQALAGLGVDYAQGYFYSKPEALGTASVHQENVLGKVS